MIPSLLLYVGLSVFALGGVTLIHPIKRIGIENRTSAAVAVGTGVALMVVAMLLPAMATRVTSVQSLLDREMSVYQFHERHVTEIAAPPERVYAAIKSVTANEIRFFQTLTWIRRGGKRLGDGILDAPGTRPILDVAVEGGFIPLAEETGKELVLATIVKAPRGTTGELTPENFRAITAPGFVKATINFMLRPGQAGTTVVSTETRVFATDDSSKGSFARYWRVIYPGSATIRRSWLQAIKRRAEKGST